MLILALLLIAAVWYGFTRYQAHKGPNEVAQVTVDGQVWCSEASCPDKLCVKQGKKHLNTDTIVCLPNKMVVTITGK